MKHHPNGAPSTPADTSVPPAIKPSAAGYREEEGVLWRSSRWSPPALAGLVRHLAEEGAAALAALPPAVRLAAWTATVDRFLDRRSEVRAHLDPLLTLLMGFSPQGFDAGLYTLLSGVTGEAAAALFADGRGAVAPPGAAVVVLAGNLPGLAVQPLVSALALGVPVLLKSSSTEPLFAPAFVDALTRREPRLRSAVAAVTWAGGDRALEDAAFAAAARVIAYGGGATMADLGARLGDRLVAYGPKLSLAVIDGEVRPEAVAPGLARDVALFDQRGCLSVQAVFTAGDASAVARALATSLAELGRRFWPPGPVEAGAAAAVQQVRAEAAMRGLEVHQLELGSGTVIVEPEPTLRPSPGLRLVRVHPVDDLSRLPFLLADWRGHLQGAALAGPGAWELADELTRLGVSRLAPPGRLQDAPATWSNGGIAPLEAFGAAPPAPVVPLAGAGDRAAD